MTKELEQSILQTLRYFDIARYPLTKEELFRFLWQPPPVKYVDFLEQLNESLATLNCPWQEKGGYYFLFGHEDAVEQRRTELVISAKKLKKARFAVKFIANVPFLKAIFVCNSVGREAAKQDSDIDLLILTTLGRLWIVRFFTNFILKIFGLRTSGFKQCDKICLSFYLSTDGLDLAQWRISNDDIHLAYWITQMVTIYDPENFYERFITANTWIKFFLPNITATKVFDSIAVNNTIIGRTWKTIWEKMWGNTYGNMIEDNARALQWHALKLSVKDRAEKPEKGVVINNQIIKLHENDRREWYRDEWKKRNINIV